MFSIHNPYFFNLFPNKCAEGQICICKHTEKAIWELNCEIYTYECIYKKSIFTIFAIVVYEMGIQSIG